MAVSQFIFLLLLDHPLGYTGVSVSPPVLNTLFFVCCGLVLVLAVCPGKFIIRFADVKTLRVVHTQVLGYLRRFPRSSWHLKGRKLC